MRFLFVVVWLLLSLACAAVGIFFTVDVLFHEIVSNDVAAAVITIILIAVLAILGVRLSRKATWGRVGVFALVGLVILLLQVFLQQSARDLLSAREQAIAEALREGLQITNVIDHVLFDADQYPVGVRLSFSLATQHSGTLYFSPQLKVPALADGRSLLVLNPVRWSKRPQDDAANYYRAGKIYQLTYDLIPGWFGWDPKTERFCRMSAGNKANERFQSAIQSEQGRRNPLELQISGSNFVGTTEDAYSFAEFAANLDLLAAAGCDSNAPQPSIFND